MTRTYKKLLSIGSRSHLSLDGPTYVFLARLVGEFQKV